MLLQVDGSPHDWLEGRGPRLCLVGAIDDATSHVPGAVFRRQEDIEGYFTILRQVVKTKGIPLSLYHDKHTIFLSPKKEVESIGGQLAGEHPLTQMGRALQGTRHHVDPGRLGRGQGAHRASLAHIPGQAGERTAAGRRKDAG